MERFDLNLLRVLVTLHRCRGVSKAAVELELSQPATSLALGRLRKRLEDPLFMRSAHGLVPTPRCEALVVAAQKALARIDQGVLAPPSFDPAEARRDFVVMTTDVGELTFLPALMAHVARQAPHCTVRCQPFDAEEMEAAMAEGRCDLVLGSLPDVESSALHAQHLFMQSFVCLVRKGHPALRAGRIDRARFLKLPQATVSPNGQPHDPFDDPLNDKASQRPVKMVVGTLLSIPSVIATTDMTAVVPRSVAEHYVQIEEGLCMVELPIDAAPYPVQQFWHPRSHHDLGLRWLRKSIRELFGDGSSRSAHPASR